MRVVITGSAGFVGSHLVDHLLANTDWDIVGLDSFRHRGDSVRVQQNPRYRVFHCDLGAPISDRLANIIGDVDFIINMASESHVDRSISDPVSFVQNNVNLSLNVLEYARKARPRHFIQISTDEVYGAALEGTDHKEWSEILPSNPYSASKAAQEAICISYWRTYDVPLTITNTMNMIGERQDAEKYVPLCISKIIKKDLLTIHGSETYIGKRHYLHARNHADALLFILDKVQPKFYDANNITEIQRPNRYNVVGDLELNNYEMASAIADALDHPNFKFKLVDFHALTARPGHDRRYSLDGSLLASLGWKAPVDFYDSLKKTVKWYQENPNWLR